MLLIICLGVAVTGADVTATLRAALLSDAEAKSLPEIVGPVAFDLDVLARACDLSQIRTQAFLPPSRQTPPLRPISCQKASELSNPSGGSPCTYESR